MRVSLPLNWRRIPYRYRLVGKACLNCGGKFFPPRSICPNCRRSSKMEDFSFSGKGKVVSYTRVFVPPAGFEAQAPYFIAIIELDEGPRLTAQVVDTEELAIGTRVKAVFRKIQQEDPEGLIHYGFKFVPLME